MLKTKTDVSNEKANSTSKNNFSLQIKRKDSLKFIINADDMGLCEERDNAIFELYSKGLISSASIMVNGFNFKKSIETAREIKMPLGLHLNLTEGFPINNCLNNSLVKKIPADSFINYDFRNNQEQIFEITNKKYDSIECYEEFHGKFIFREKLNRKEVHSIDIKNEIISQIERFIKYYKSPPVHLDGHQHIHIIPEIAEIISEIMSNYFAIYHIRIPEENEELFDNLVYEVPYNDDRRNFHKKIINDCKISRKIYSRYNILSTENFIGMTVMGKNLTENNMKISKDIYLNKIENKSKSRKEDFRLNPNTFSTELMIHPGYVGKNGFWDAFNCSEERLYEKKTVEYLFESGILNKEDLINFTDLEYFDSSSQDIEKISTKNILILGDITYGTGNLITAQRLKRIFKDLGHNSFFYNVRFLLSKENEDYDQLKKFIVNKRIGLVVGINVWRAGKIIYDLINEIDGGDVPNLIKVIPFMFIVAGTDANCFVKDDDKLEIMREVMAKSEISISFNEEMLLNLEKHIKGFNFKIIPQSVFCLEAPNLATEKDQLLKKFELSSDRRIILFPSGMRSVKDPLFVLNEICQFLNVNENYVCILLGSIYDENLYEEIKERTKNSPNFIISTSLERKDFIRLLKESCLVINSSICEGMSNVIMESLCLGIPVLARKNEGNSKLIKDNLNGLLFEDKEEFSNKLRILLSEDDHDIRMRNTFIENGKQTIKDSFSYENEVLSYDRVLKEIFSKYFFRYEKYNLFFSKDTHPFSEENNIIFESHKIDLIKKINSIPFQSAKEINILDVGCGAGIFSFIFILKNLFNHLLEVPKNIEDGQVEFEIMNINLFLTDIDPHCILSSFINFNNYKELFQNFLCELEGRIFKINLKLNDLSVGDLIKNYSNKEDKYLNYFDYILANLPQTPSQDSIRRDKHGGSQGVNLYLSLFEDLKKIISTQQDDKDKNTEILFLHISLSNPLLLDKFLNENGYASKMIYEQTRSLNPNNLRIYSPTLKEYMLKLREEGSSEFNILDENEWKYKVWAKKVYLTDH